MTTATAIIALAVFGQGALRTPEIRCKVREEVALVLVLDGDGRWIPTSSSVTHRTCGPSPVLRRGLRRRP